MKTLIRTTLFACLAIAAVSCKKEKPEEKTSVDPPVVSSYPFLKEGFECKYGTKDGMDSQSFDSYINLKYGKGPSGSARWDVTTTDETDTTVIDVDQIEIVIESGILTFEDLPINMLNPKLNEIKEVGDYLIRLVAQDVQVTTPKGTFSCNKFEVKLDGDVSHVIYADKNYVYPFIKLLSVYDGEEDGGSELVK